MKNRNNTGIVKALMMADEFSPQAVQIMIDIATCEHEEGAQRMRALALIVKFLELGKDLFSNRVGIDVPIEKLTTRQLINELIPDMADMVVVNEIKQIGDANV